MGLKLIYAGGSGPLAEDYPNPLYTIGETYEVLRSQPGYVVMTSNHQFNGLEWTTLGWAEHFRLPDGGAPPAAPEASPAKALTDERKGQHGDWLQQSLKAHHLKMEMHAQGEGWIKLQPHQREALDMIAVKISRILSGDPNHADHWDDIAGYAYLGKSGHDK